MAAETATATAAKSNRLPAHVARLGVRAAVANRRANRRAAKLAKEKREAPRPLPKVMAVGTTALTRREVHQLAEAAEPLVEAGRIDIRYMGVHYLELQALGWTKEELDCTDAEFDEVWAWWSLRLSQEDRKEVVQASRFVRIGG